jgi:hypothetical protein
MSSSVLKKVEFETSKKTGVLDTELHEKTEKSFIISDPSSSLQ